jgi:hypothetical protein
LLEVFWERHCGCDFGDVVPVIWVWGGGGGWWLPLMGGSAKKV